MIRIGLRLMPLVIQRDEERRNRRTDLLARRTELFGLGTDHFEFAKNRSRIGETTGVPRDESSSLQPGQRRVTRYSINFDGSGMSPGRKRCEALGVSDHQRALCEKLKGIEGLGMEFAKAGRLTFNRDDKQIDRLRNEALMPHSDQPE